MTAAPTMGRVHVLDDLASRPGSANSLVRTVVGVAIRACGGWLSTATCIELMEAAGVPANRTRTALTRVKGKGLLVAERRDGRAGYALTPDGAWLLARGDRRIYGQRSMRDGDPWCLISFSIPEEQRSLRHQFRQRLSWIGAGNVSPALWIVPDYLRAELEEIVQDLALTAQVTLFTVQGIQNAGVSGSALAREWWDLDALRALHDDFLEAHSATLAHCAAEPDPAVRFGLWIRALDAWRPIPYLDPGLPDALLPPDWPGARSGELFRALHAATRDAVAAILDRHGAEVASA